MACGSDRDWAEPRNGTPKSEIQCKVTMCKEGDSCLMFIQLTRLDVDFVYDEKPMIDGLVQVNLLVLYYFIDCSGVMVNFDCKYLAIGVAVVSSWSVGSFYVFFNQTQKSFR